jgi:diphosphomevalonate decarboxylase
MQTVWAQAPANLALVKYMGKKDAGLNLPANPSVSFTLGSLRTLAEVSSWGRGDSRWVPELPSGASGFEVPKLSAASIQRMVDHIERVRQQLPRVFDRFGMVLERENDGVLLKTANTFPASSGIASSASSFAAMTLALVLYFAGGPTKRAFLEDLWKQDASWRREVAALARQGSGSACRSFEGPWVCWKEAWAQAVPHRMPALSHFVLILDASPKEVSSSEAHAKVRSSALWEQRVVRATLRTQEMLEAISTGDVVRVGEIAWKELWEMHSLFHTSEVPFSYWRGKTIEVLQWAKLQRLEDPQLIVTLDAGPNVHFLVPSARRDFWKQRLEHQFEAVLLMDEQGMGATFFQPL